MTLSDLFGLVGRTLASPREGAEEVLALGIPRESHWILLALVVVLSVLLAQASRMLSVAAGRVEEAAAMPGFGLSIALVLGSLVLLIALVQGVGRAFGGNGVIDETVVLMCWLEFISTVLAAGQLVLTLILPPLGVLAIIAIMGIELWLLTHFVAVIHGFRSLGRVFGVILGGAIALGFVALIILSALGIAPDVNSGGV